jgi:predicted glutamine amidotransferase
MEVNCHPFSAGRLLWMHNGQIGGFPAIKRKLVNLVSEERYRGIQGSTDTEHALALFLDALPDPTQAVAPDQIRRGLFTMIECLTKLTRDNHIDETSYLNICVTNGEDVVAMRYVSEKAEKAHSLYWSEEGQYVTLDGVPHLVDTVSSERGVIVSSEKLTEREKDWNPIPQNHLVVIRKDLSVKVEEIGR